MTRALAVIALLGAMLPMQAMAQRQIAVADGAEIPLLRPCIDYAGRGALRTIGKPASLAERPPAQTATPRHLTIAVEGDASDDGADTIILSGYWDAIYRFRFDERVSLYGKRKGRGVTLTKAYHSLEPIRIADAIVFAAERHGVDRMVDWEPVWRDDAGRPFLPIMTWPEPSNEGYDWRPQAIREFARPVRYSDPQSSWFPPLRASDAELYPDLFAMRGRRVTVRYGLYLADLPALFEAAKTEPCWL